MKTILVTGADGFIGSHLTESLVSQGYQVRAFVLYNSFNSWGWLDHSPKEILDSLEVFSGDIRDPYGVKSAMQGCDIVLHLAALIAIPYSYHSPATYVDTNITGTLNVVQAARELGVQKVVHTSTSEVYGTAQFVPITEEHPLQGQSPYSASKIGADQVAMSFYRSFGTPVSIIRPFNTYGPRQSARAVIPTVITQIANGNRKIKLGALHPTRDFNYVKDTVRGFITIAESQNSVGEVINIGSNFEISIGDTVNLIAEAMGVDIEIETDDVRLRPEKSEVNRLWADNSKAKRLVGWEPLYGGREGFKRGLAETAAWFMNPANLVGYKSNQYNI
ncbi:NAD-dependent 4,6-dehydratase LegB [Sphaerospermopsis torques-reginae]|uniref:NAD-dependent 4,6-dehydratase LegB n=1 Tax=Sphaerospermopsis torques-reginae ITEP-024 TaxID=984208 RepID=A0ABX8WU50_9CYAN|nr:NAD-dependent 4,6-dehydratase LegB [Sphaerospermopsis torques-reginae]QYX29915.1 NAD-dependent 4,6-dehydratase LegB [Sphaerospermopsis torques-reginae ITEP-024]